jgi:hypothetical protein
MAQSTLWHPCPRCGSTRVQEISKWLLPFTAWGLSGCVLLVGFVFPPLWLMLSVFAVMAFMGLFGKTRLQCKDCNLNWNPKKPPTFPRPPASPPEGSV